MIYLFPRIEWDLAALAEELQLIKEAGFGGGWYHDGYEGFGPVFGDFSYFPDKKGAPFMSPGHLDKLNGFLEEANKQELQFVPPIRAMYMSGGPWIDQEHAAKEYTLSKTFLTGPGKRQINPPLPSSRDADAVAPADRKAFYRDTRVVAWPVSTDPRQTAMHRQKPVITVSNPDSHRERVFLADGNGLSAMPIYGMWLLPYGPRPKEMPKETVITYEFPAPFEAVTCFVKLNPDKSQFSVRVEISCSEDGKTFRRIADLSVSTGTEKRVGFAGAKARWYRVTFPPLTNRMTLGVAEIEFLALGEEPVTRERILNFNQKSARACWDQSLATKGSDFYGSQVFYETGEDPALDGVIRRADVRDLTALLRSDGTLDWDVPEGTWCIMRLGYTLAKHGYTPARPGGEGYECDIYNAESTHIQFDNVPRRILRALSPEARKALQGFWFTGFELGPTNWTASLPEEFVRHVGYEMTSWLPVLADETVEGVEQSDAFLADFRRTLHYLFAQNHHGVMKELSTQDGLEFFSKTGVSKQANQDALMYLSRAHVPSGESPGGREDTSLGYDNRVFQPFGGRSIVGEGPWWTSDAQTKLPASASHIYGNSQIVAGSAGEGRGDHQCDRVPAFDKHAVDRAFCMGANQLHDGWTHDNRKGVYPGLHHWPWLSPRNTTFRQSVAFHQYVSRCQSLLQQGLFQADMLIAMEGSFHLVGRAASQTHPKVYVPKGCDFDFITRELVMQDLKVEDGALVLSSGMRYRVLQIPDFVNRMSVEYMRKLEELLRAGAVIVAPKPVTGNTGLDFADGLAQHRELAERLWAGLDGKKVTSKGYGKGRLYWGASLDEVLEAEGVRPDFAYTGVRGPAYVDHIHRRIEASDIDFYFLANAVNEAAEIKARFRGQGGKVPYLFEPLSGEVRPIRQQRLADGDSEIVLTMEPVGSVFVVFAPGDAPAQPKSSEMAAKTLPAPIAITGPWSVEFRDMFGESFRREFPELRSFHLSTDDQVKYFSGEASYRNTFTLPAGALKDHRWYQECGEVRWLAEIKVNGKTAGIVWCPPWRVEITPYLREGENELEVVCANPWKNRMIGESRRPAAERKVVLTNFRMSIEEFKEMELMEAGLLGPMRLMAGPQEGESFRN